MKVKLLCRKEMKEKIMNAIANNVIEYCDDGDIVLYEVNNEYQYLLVKDGDEYIRVLIEDIIYIESVSQEIYVHTPDGKYKSKDTMYQLEANLYEKGILHIHKAYIVNNKCIKRIRSSLNTKFTLILSDSAQVEVLRSYYYRFKEEMGF